MVHTMPILSMLLVIKSSLRQKYLALCIGFIGLFSACDTPEVLISKELVGASHVAFRCVDLNDTTQGVPLDRCGCIQTQLSSDLTRSIEILDRDSCIERQKGTKLLAYFASAVTSEVALIDMDDTQRRVVNLDTTIPEVTMIRSDGLISDLLVHPYGDFTLVLLGMEGKLQLLQDPFAFRPELSLDLAVGSIGSAVIWPRPDMPLPKDNASSLLYILAVEEAKILELDLDRLSLGLQEILAGTEGAEELDTQSIDQTLFQSAIIRSWQVLDDNDQAISLGKISVDPSQRYLVATHQTESKISIIDLQDDTANRREVSFDFASDCDDIYLINVLESDEAIGTCQDGIDNDGNSLIDERDPMCQSFNREALYPQCPQVSQCADQLDNDEDGLIDSEDDDCNIDTFDPTQCTDDPQRCLARFFMWEGTPPACDDGIDNDDDGLIDRFDPGCRTQLNTNESLDFREISTCLDGIDNDQDQKIDLEDEDCILSNSRQQRLAYPSEGDLNGVEDLCLDQLDNDLDGLTDQEDPGCFALEANRNYPTERIPRCADGIDNDFDGLIDYQGSLGGDPDCSSASDQNEASSIVITGSNLLMTNTLEGTDESYSFAYVMSPNGSLLAIDLDTSDSQKIRTLAPEMIVQSATLRQQGNLANLWVLDKDLSLQSLNITAPQALSTAQGYPVYGLMQSTNQGSTSILASTDDNISVFEAFYTVYQGQALRIDALNPWLDQVTYDSSTQKYMIADDANIVLEQVLLDDLNPVDLNPESKGYGDQQVFIDSDTYPLWMKPWNRFQDALGQSTRVVGQANLSVNQLKTNLNIEYYPAFCRVLSSNESNLSALFDNDNKCIVIGYNETGQEETEEARTARLASYIDSYEGIQVIADRPQEVEEGVYKLAYEDRLPQTKSNSGSMMQGDDRSWTMVDYKSNYCSLGVEVGDLLIVEKFYPYDAQASTKEICLPYLNRTPDEGRDPLRYKIESVQSHRLVLVSDNESNYDNQVPPTSTGSLPRLADSLPPPPYECVSQEIAYYIRVGSKQWLLTNNGKYRHAWRSVSGQCEQDERAIAKKRDFRLRADANDDQQGLNTLFENEWFRFRLGYQSETATQAGVAVNTLPYMVDVFYEFYVASGYKSNFYDFTARSPQDIFWLPEKDRIYITDAAAQELIEYRNLDPYTDFVTFSGYFR